MNIWKSYIWTADKDVNMKVIFAVMNRPEFFFRPYFHYCLSSVHYREDRFHIHGWINSTSNLTSSPKFLSTLWKQAVLVDIIWNLKEFYTKMSVSWKLLGMLYQISILIMFFVLLWSPLPISRQVTYFYEIINWA